jgi:hypothetical protein
MLDSVEGRIRRRSPLLFVTILPFIHCVPEIPTPNILLQCRKSIVPIQHAIDRARGALCRRVNRCWRLLLLLLHRS